MSDYKSAHLAWLKATKTFSPQHATDYRSDISYYDVIHQLYQNPNVTQQQAELFFLSDKRWLKNNIKISKSIDKKLESSDPTPNGWWFVTIGFNHDSWNITDCKKLIEQLISMEWIISAKANFELFRENGQHPHAHFLIETKEVKSSILYKLFRPLYVKKLVFKRNFIDVKIALPCHINYINLIKQELKMPFVEQDIIWRQQNSIPDYEKNYDNTKVII